MNNEQRTNNRDLLDNIGFADIFLLLIPAFVRRVGNSGKMYGKNNTA